MNKYHLITGVIAFISVISFFQANSYWADKANLNWLCWAVGIGAGLWAIVRIIYMNKGGGKQE